MIDDATNGSSYSYTLPSLSNSQCYHVAIKKTDKELVELEVNMTNHCRSLHGDSLLSPDNLNLTSNNNLNNTFEHCFICG